MHSCPVLLVRREIGWRIAFGVAAIAGHVQPIFLLGKGGGKGVATASGVFLALAPLAMLFSMLSFAAVVAASRLCLARLADIGGRAAW